MNLPEIFVQFLKVTVSLPNNYLKQRKGREVLARFIVHVTSHNKCIGFLYNIYLMYIIYT